MASSKRKTITCKECGGEMVAGKKAEANILLQVLGVLVFLMGLMLVFMFVVHPVSRLSAFA